MKKILIALIILAEISVMYGGNPIMVIRCRANAVAPTSTSPTSLFRAETVCDDDNTVSFEGHCFPLAAADGTCTSIVISGFDDLTLAPQMETIGGVEMTICVPDCSSKGTGAKWSASDQECVCFVGSEAKVIDTSSDYVTCGCPAPLEAVVIIPSIVDGTTGCQLPTKECYQAGININIDPITCDSENPATQEYKIVLTKAGGAPWVDGDAVTLTDLKNCNLLNNTNGVLDIFESFGDDARPAFTPIDVDGVPTIEIVFTKPNPNEDSEIVLRNAFVQGADQTDAEAAAANVKGIIVASCPPIVTDPCSCGPDNIVDSDGVVQFWYDELSFIGNPNQDVTVVTNTGGAGMGFLDEANQAPIVAGTILGQTDADGILTYPFFRAPGAPTEVTLQDALSTTTTILSSTCDLSVNACNNVVPTMGEWSVIVLSLMMLIVGLVSMKHKSGTLIPIKERVKK